MNEFKHKRIAIDFDGTLFDDCKNIDEFFSLNKELHVKPNANEVTSWLKAEGFEILIFTCRPDYHRKYMENLLTKNKIIYDYILFYTKPRVDLYIDDKGFRFNNWKDTKRWIKNKLSTSQEPDTDFEEILRKNKIEPLGDLNLYDSIIDIGCGSGDVFNNIKNLPIIDAVEPDQNLKKIASKLDLYNKIYNSISEVDLSKYKLTTVLGVLEHIENESEFLDQFKNSNQIYITVPNAESFHRLVGVDAGIIDSPYELSFADYEIGHQRYYDQKSFMAVIKKNLIDPYSFKIHSFGTTSLKFCSNSQMIQFKSIQKSIETVGKKLSICGENNFFGAELYIHLIKNKI